MINTNALRSYTLNNPVWEQLSSVPSCFIKMPMSFKSNDPHFVMHKLDSSDRCNTTVVTFQANTVTSIQQICNTICIYIVMTKWGLELPTETRQRAREETRVIHHEWNGVAGGLPAGPGLLSCGVPLPPPSPIWLTLLLPHWPLLCPIKLGSHNHELRPQTPLSEGYVRVCI